jgi:integrase
MEGLACVPQIASDYSCGVAPKVIQAILRHGDIGTTLAYYVSTPDAEAREALQKIDDWVSIV